MNKYLAVFCVAALIAGCTPLDQKEARCKCFKSDGTPTGNCDFTRLPADPAKFSFMATRGTADLISFTSTASGAGNICHAGS